MLLKSIKGEFLKSEVYNEIKNIDTKSLIVSKIVGSEMSFYISNLYKEINKNIILVFDNREEAAFYYNDLQVLCDKDNVSFFPNSYKKPYITEDVDNANVLSRSKVLQSLSDNKTNNIIVTYTEAIFEKVISKKQLNNQVLSLAVAEVLEIDDLNEMLFDLKFDRVEFVSQPGEFSVRGGIVDVFSYTYSNPFRIEFFDDEIESIRTFDIGTQLSIEKTKKANITANTSTTISKEKRVSLLEFLNDDSLVFCKNRQQISSKLDRFFDMAKDVYNKIDSPIERSKPDDLFYNKVEFEKDLKNKKVIYFGLDNCEDSRKINSLSSSQPSFTSNFDLLAEYFKEYYDKGYKNYIFCLNEKQARIFHEVFEDKGVDKYFETLICPLYKGFSDEGLKINCFTDHEFFERYHRFKLKNNNKQKQNLSIKELTALKIGDYVTHIDHGVGKFAGLQKIDVENAQQEAIKLIYGDRDILYVSIHSLYKISKYNGKEGTIPKLHKLGSPAWKKAKQQTKVKVKKIAFDLIQLYAKRKLQKGYAFNEDSLMQHRLEASFIYEDTPDQYKATKDVKNDMESDQPMDRLVCGDVGFGKTEVAIRAAFKAVDNGKQVAILVPTTILAYQHYKTFKERLKDFPVTVDYLNRFRKAKDKKELLISLEQGATDIVIGTHQLVGKSVQFKDLGLLVIDEEQKFGVSVKDKLKTIRENVDTLTLTATPIPRTLQFSLMSARDLSIINTPPPNRLPIDTSLIRLDIEQIRDSIDYELSRNGQVFFINNRIENIEEVAGMLQRMVPDAKIRTAHGRMEGKKMEELLLGFINHEFDVLVSTTIIESGLDIPNANTIFINDSQRFGLSDLHQMRGRVGRSNKQSFCYLISPPLDMITPEAQKRLEALVLFSDLGSGLQIAMKDLEIRGSGDLLGGEQSGFINDIGFETYKQILNEAIKELKENEFKDLYEDKESDTVNDYIKDIQIDTDLEIMIPDDYVSVVSERLKLYNLLNNIENEEELIKYEIDLKDRFGEIPEPTEALLDSVRLKWIAKKSGLEKVVLKKKRMIGYFIQDPQSDFYKTDVFSKMLQYVHSNRTSSVMKEKETKSGKKLIITFIKINDVKTALNTLRIINT
ncbi:MAG: transcription-repair coupling factor [Flavobacteriaceae bacterium]|nr:transcription-repair coupling factor [Flavobacteriaceae bacterium]